MSQPTHSIARLALFFSLLLVIPLLCYGGAAYLQAKNRSEFYALIREETPFLSEAQIAAISIDKFCQDPSPLTRSLCQEQRKLDMVRYGAILAVLGGVTLPLGLLLVGWLAKVDAAYLAGLFKAGLYLTVAVFTLLAAMHAALILAILRYGQVAPSLFVLGAIGIGVAGGLLVMAKIACKLIRKTRPQVVGCSVTRDEVPELWARIDETARRVGTQPPQQFVVGLDPGFFVTEAEVSCLDGIFAGRTLYCALPLCRLLSSDEFLAILGHELRHFKRGNKEISANVYPLYRGTSTALAEYCAARHHPAWSVLSWPVTTLLACYLDSFAAAIQSYNRKREYAADRVGAQITNSKAYAAALVKFHHMTAQEEGLRRSAARALTHGQLPANLSAWFAAAVAQSMDVPSVSRLAGTSVGHPIDVHPPLAKRLKYIHEDIARAAAEVCSAPPADAAIGLIPGAERLEEELSAVYLPTLAHAGGR